MALNALSHIQKARRSPIASFTYVFNDNNFNRHVLSRKLHRTYTVAFCNGIQNQLSGHQPFQESSPLSSAIPLISTSTQRSIQSSDWRKESSSPSSSESSSSSSSSESTSTSASMGIASLVPLSLPLSELGTNSKSAWDATTMS